jgi:hypothetical protein
MKFLKKWTHRSQYQRHTRWHSLRCGTKWKLPIRLFGKIIPCILFFGSPPVVEYWLPFVEDHEFWLGKNQLMAFLRFPVIWKVLYLLRWGTIFFFWGGGLFLDFCSLPSCVMALAGSALKPRSESHVRRSGKAVQIVPYHIRKALHGFIFCFEFELTSSHGHWRFLPLLVEGPLPSITCKPSPVWIKQTFTLYSLQGRPSLLPRVSPNFQNLQRWAMKNTTLKFWGGGGQAMGELAFVYTWFHNSHKESQ